MIFKVLVNFSPFRLTIFGSNEIYIEVKSYFRLLVDEVLNPFYMFQVFSVTLWCFDEYYYYAVCVVLISGFSIGVSLYKTRQQTLVLQQMARGADSLVTIRLPNGGTLLYLCLFLADINVSIKVGTKILIAFFCRTEESEISFRDVVPGDILLIPPEGCTMPCDAVLIQGSCIVNESMLTGESVPVNKSAMLSSHEIFTCENHKKHVMFCGTQVIQPRFYAGSKVSIKKIVVFIPRKSFNCLIYGY